MNMGRVAQGVTIEGKNALVLISSTGESNQESFGDGPLLTGRTAYERNPSRNAAIRSASPRQTLD